jgi:hypothetical protein
LPELLRFLAMSADRSDYPLHVWDRQWWRYLDVLGGANRDEVPNATDVYDRLVQYAFAGDIDWEQVVRADSLQEAKRGLASLFRRMAGDLTTSEQLEGLLTSMNGAAEQSGRFREATGSAGEILERRALQKRGAPPLPSGWQDVLASFTGTAPATGGDYWARRILAVARSVR